MIQNVLHINLLEIHSFPNGFNKSFPGNRCYAGFTSSETAVACLAGPLCEQFYNWPGNKLSETN